MAAFRARRGSGLRASSDGVVDADGDGGVELACLVASQVSLVKGAFEGESDPVDGRLDLGGECSTESSPVLELLPSRPG